MSTFGIVGYGVIGKAFAAGYRRNGIEPVIYDKAIEPYTQIAPSLLRCSAIVVAVPTPSGAKGYNLHAVQSVLSKLADRKFEGVVVIGSTLGVGDYDRLVHYAAGRKASYSLAVAPEFVTERNAAQDLYSETSIVYGPELLPELDGRVREALSGCRERGTVRFYRMPADHCALVKTQLNLALAMKLAAANAMFVEARDSGLSARDAQRIVDMVFGDARLKTERNYHTVGNSEGSLGFGGTCLVKDLRSKSTSVKDTALREMLEALYRFNAKLRQRSFEKSHASEMERIPDHSRSDEFPPRESQRLAGLD